MHLSPQLSVYQYVLSLQEKRVCTYVQAFLPSDLDGQFSQVQAPGAQVHLSPQLSVRQYVLPLKGMTRGTVLTCMPSCPRTWKGSSRRCKRRERTCRLHRSCRHELLPPCDSGHGLTYVQELEAWDLLPQHDPEEDAWPLLPQHDPDAEA